MSSGISGQPKLGDLLARFLNRQTEAQALGLQAFDAGEVTPYEAGPVQPIDPKLAWEGALAALDVYRPGSAQGLRVPPQWSQLVAAHEPVVALAFSVANFPQLVRNFHLILQKANLTELKPAQGRKTEAPALVEWAREAAKSFPQTLLVLGALRLAKNFELADELIAQADAKVPPEWRAAWDNDRAALLWHSGRTSEARAVWQRLDASPAVLFNRGMAALFTGDGPAAREALTEAVAQLPEASAWHHLARLYLTLAQTR